MEECETKDNFCANSDECKDGNSVASDIVEDRDTGFVEETLSNSDNFEIESGVESATGDVTEADWTELAELLDLNSHLTGSDESLRLGDLDLTTEQAQETLKYFTLASDRTNQMTKTHNDLDAILQLLQEKEKDLELAARIGQSLLERNKQLLVKTQAFESFVAECDEKETQLQHEVSMKNELLQKFLRDQELEEYYQLSHRSDEDSRSSDSFCRDESINSLQQKCQALEQQNTHLILEALQIKEETASAEMKEQQLVLDCVKQLVEAKDQISSLTDEISQKAEDNIRQQEEITHLITTVVDLQTRHKELSSNNDDLQSLLNSSQANQEQLKTQVNDLQEKYHECLEMLMENQREVKKLNTKIESDMVPRKRSQLPYHDSRDSIALEIEESVKRDLTTQQEKSYEVEQGPGSKCGPQNIIETVLSTTSICPVQQPIENWQLKEHTARVMETVRVINTGSSGRRTRKTGLRASKSGAGFQFDPSGIVTGSAENGGAAANSQTGTPAAERRISYSGRRSFRAPEKLQIVKPIKGSVTLHQWKKLANPTLNLAEERPGVHVKGQDREMGTGEPREQTDLSDMDPDDLEYEEDASVHMRSVRTSESASEATSHTGTNEGDDHDDDNDDDDGPIQMRISRNQDKGTPVSKAEKGASVKRPSSLTPPQNMGLMPLVSGHGLQRTVDSGGILAHLLSGPSTSSPTTSSVGQVLAEVLNKASKEASEKEPTRAASLRNLAKYFSDKERGTNPTPVKTKAPASSPVIQMPKTSSPAGGLLSKVLASSSLSANLTFPSPITTTAKSTGLPTTTTTSTSTSPSILTRGTLVRNSSGSNLLSLAQASLEDDTSGKRHSLDSAKLLKTTSGALDSPPDFSQLNFPTLRRRASSGDLQETASGSSSLDDLSGNGSGMRLYRSSSFGNIKDLSNENLAGPSRDVSEGGFLGRLRRTPSIGSLTNLVQRSNLTATLPGTLGLRSTSLESLPVFKPGESPPSPSKFDQDGTSFFGRGLSTNNAPSASVDTLAGASGKSGFGIGTRLSGLAGLRGFWSQGGSKSLEMPSPPMESLPLQPKSEERLEKINSAFAFEDFGGLGLMSFFGRKSRDNR